MEREKAESYGDELYRALRERRTVIPLTEREPNITIDEAYQIQMRLVELELNNDKERIVGKKIGVTSEVVQKMLGVDQPDFGHLTSGMVYRDGEVIPMDRLIQPRAEGEIAFVLKRALAGPGITNGDVLEATEYIAACFEIVDSRIRDWKIRIQDTVADNASCGVFVLGTQAVSPASADFTGCRMVLEKNTVVAGTGVGAASLGSPINAVTWLANTLGGVGIALEAGEVILSGSLGPLVPVAAGDQLRVTIDGIGSVAVRFA